MDYEKKYKEALERAKEYVAEYDFEEAVKEIFPELKEDGDEKIRKELIFYLGDMPEDTELRNGVTNRDVLVWLEKQGEIDMKPYKEAEDEKREFVGDGFIKCYADFQDFKEGETYWLEYVGNDNYNVRSDNLLGKTYHITPCQLYTIFKKMTWLEKQGEQKPNYTTLVETGNGGINALVTRELSNNDYEQKPAWTKEDERKIQDCIDAVSHVNFFKVYYQNELVEWLKSLKQRIGG